MIKFITKVVDNLEFEVFIANPLDEDNPEDIKALNEMINHGNCYEKLRSMLDIVIVGKKNSKEILRDSVNKEFFNLAYVVRIKLVSGDYISFPKNLAEFIEVKPETIIKDAIENTLRTNKYEHHIISKFMYDKYKEINDKEIIEAYEEDYGKPINEVVTVATNSEKNYGNTCILSTEFMDSVAKDFGGSFRFVISSYHEIIIFPKTDSNNYIKTITFMNNRKKEQLDIMVSDSIYMYSPETKKITIVEV